MFWNQFGVLLTWIRIRNHQILRIRIQSIRIRNTGKYAENSIYYYSTSGHVELKVIYSPTRHIKTQNWQLILKGVGYSVHQDPIYLVVYISIPLKWSMFPFGAPILQYKPCRLCLPLETRTPSLGGVNYYWTELELYRISGWPDIRPFLISGIRPDIRLNCWTNYANFEWSNFFQNLFTKYKIRVK